MSAGSKTKEELSQADLRERTSDNIGRRRAQAPVAHLAASFLVWVDDGYLLITCLWLLLVIFVWPHYERTYIWTEGNGNETEEEKARVNETRQRADPCARQGWTRVCMGVWLLLRRRNGVCEETKNQGKHAGVGAELAGIEGTSSNITQ